MTEKTKPLASITYKGVVEVARRWFKRGKLQAQTRPGACRYAGPCVIGCALPPRVRDRLDTHSDARIATLLQQGVIHAPNKDHDRLAALQDAHDYVDLRGIKRLARLLGIKKSEWPQSKST